MRAFTILAALAWLCALGHIAFWSWIFVELPTEPEFMPFFKRLGSAVARVFSH